VFERFGLLRRVCGAAVANRSLDREPLIAALDHLILGI